MDRAELDRRIASVARDNQTGASRITEQVVAILGDALAAGEPILPVAKALCRAHPTMAPVWNACAEAMTPDGARRLEHFGARLRRAPDAIARFALEQFSESSHRRQPIRLVTISSSGTVLRVLTKLRSQGPLEVSCSESRPALEGRALSAQLAAAGIPVRYFGDAAIGSALAEAAAVIVGADAVASDWFINKSGTAMLAAAASYEGVPVYVVASRDKFASPLLATCLAPHGGEPSEIWAEAPPGVRVLNPYFERTQLELVTAVISDVGALGAALLPAACEAIHDRAALEAVRTLRLDPDA